jgi:hypothetical protein
MGIRGKAHIEGEKITDVVIEAAEKLKLILNTELASITQLSPPPQEKIVVINSLGCRVL